MIIFDELPTRSLMNEHNRINAERYPNFESLSKNATWYRNATTVADHTEFSLTAILTGLYPERLKLGVPKDYPNSIFTLFGGSYEMRVFESLTKMWVEPKEDEASEGIVDRLYETLKDLLFVYLQIVLPPEWSKGFPSVSQGWGNFGADDNNSDQQRYAFNNPSNQFKRFLNSINTENEATLYFIHLILPHRPWRYLPSGKDYGLYPVEGMDLQQESWADNEIQVLKGYQRHLLQVGFADRLLGQVIDRLESTKLYDKSAIIVAADHGISFGCRR